MNLAQWKNAGVAFSYRGHTVYYREQGTGDVLVCIHGFPTASWDWHRIWPELVKRFRVIALDMIGFGFSDKPKDYAYSLRDQATLHERLLDTLGIRHVHILAHDYGDTVAQELLARHEDRLKFGQQGIEIKSVCLLNGGIFPETHRPLLIQKLLMSPLGPLVSRFVSESSFRASFSAIFAPPTRPSDNELREFWTLIRHNDGARIMHNIIRYMRERRVYRERWVGVLQNTRVPLRMINGAVDPVSGAQVVARYRELIPNPDIVVLETIGHYPQVEDPQAVLDAFFAFVNRVSD
jgi:pimeloyl-ACP methyl ester carboxylesterase